MPKRRKTFLKKDKTDLTAAIEEKAKICQNQTNEIKGAAGGTEFIPVVDENTDECSKENKQTDTRKGAEGAAAFVQNIRGNNIQIGNENRLYDCQGTGKAHYDTTVLSRNQGDGGTCKSVFPSDIQTQNVIANTVNIQLPGPNADKKGKDIPVGINTFLSKVNNFEKGHYILVVDRLTGVNELEHLSLVNWIMVIDFDPESRTSGLLSYVEKSVPQQRRSLHIVSWQEEKFNFTDSTLYWIGIKGHACQPDITTEVKFQEWKRQIKGNFQQQLDQLKTFGKFHTYFTVVALWPDISDNFKHFQFILNEINDTLCPKEIVIVDDGSKKSKEAESVLNILTDDFTSVTLDLKGVCKAVCRVCKSMPITGDSYFQLPTADVSNDPKISDSKAQWLREDLDVLYLRNETGVTYDSDGLAKEENNFFIGGTLPWSYWYQVGPGRVDIEREITHEIVHHIKKGHIDICRTGCIKLFHNPGTGGTTLAQRITWSLMRDVPCVEVKHKSNLSISEIADKIEFLFDKTRLPVFALIDGGDEQKVDTLMGILGGRCCVIILYVKRGHMANGKVNRSNKVFSLKPKLSQKETETISVLYKKQCKHKWQKENIDDLLHTDRSHSVFDFGFAVYSYNYKGIASYVSSHLNFDTNDENIANKRQKALAYLSLVYYYGQASLPCNFFARLMGIDNVDIVLDLADLPEDVQELLVEDLQERCMNFVRVAHHCIAKEILDQVLVYPSHIERDLQPTLSDAAKMHLGELAVEFIKEAAKFNGRDVSSTISNLMKRTFILRDYKAVGENETQVAKRRQKFSQILEDSSSKRPFTERFSIYKSLTDCFPLEAQFRAHLGRLYSHCRPDKSEEAEKCFKEALDICKSDSNIHDVNDMPLDNISMNHKLDLMHIYHMYGNMIVKQVAKYTGRNIGDTPNIQIKTFDGTANYLLPKVVKACELFKNCRDVTPIGCEASFGYIGEIQIRLMYCDFVHRNWGQSGGVLQYIKSGCKTTSVRFVEQSIPLVDELFLSCFSGIEPEKMDANVFGCIHWYYNLFEVSNAHVSRKCASDAFSRRLEIAKVKMKYCKPNLYGIIEHINDEDDVAFIVEELEKIFQEYESRSINDLPSKRAMDLDYREWLVAIRHNLFKEDYAVDKVLRRVEQWHATLQTPHSLFYLFVLKSLHGIGNASSQGDNMVLRDAQSAKEEMLKKSNYVPKPRYPREWLGLSCRGIRQLASGLRFFGQVEGREIKEEIDFDTLEVQKGTISAPNDRPAAGYISLDLGPEKRVSVKVFFVPVRSNLQGSSYTNTRVEFVIGFSLSHGYEAFNVRILEHQQCLKCMQNVEKRSCDKKVLCPRCESWVAVNDSKKQTKQSRNGSKIH